MPELPKREEKLVGQRHTFAGANSIMSLPEPIHVHTKTALLHAHCWAASPLGHKGGGEVSWIMLPLLFFGGYLCIQLAGGSAKLERERSNQRQIGKITACYLGKKMTQPKPSGKLRAKRNSIAAKQGIWSREAATTGIPVWPDMKYYYIIVLGD